MDADQLAQIFNDPGTDPQERANILMTLVALADQGHLPRVQLDESLSPVGARSIVKRLNRKIQGAR